MEDDPVVEAVAGELAEVLDGLGRVVVEELERDRAHGLCSCWLCSWGPRLAGPGRRAVGARRPGLDDRRLAVAGGLDRVQRADRGDRRVGRRRTLTPVHAVDRARCPDGDATAAGNVTGSPRAGSRVPVPIVDGSTVRVWSSSRWPTVSVQVTDDLLAGGAAGDRRRRVGDQQVGAARAASLVTTVVEVVGTACRVSWWRRTAAAASMWQVTLPPWLMVVIAELPAQVPLTRAWSWWCSTRTRPTVPGWIFL